MKRTSFWVLVLKGLIVLHRTIQLQLLQHYWSGHRLGRITVILSGLPWKRTEIRLPTSVGSSKKQDNSRKTSNSASLTMLKPLAVWITTNWKILKEMGMPGHITCLLRNLYAGQEATVRTRQRQWTGSELGKEYIKAACCHTAYLTYMQSTPCEMPGWMKHKLESRLLWQISITSDMQRTPPLWQKAKKN